MSDNTNAPVPAPSPAPAPFVPLQQETEKREYIPPAQKGR